MRSPWWLLPLALFACDDGKGGGDDDDDSGDGDTADTVDESIAPEILSVDNVSCTEYQSAGEAWAINLTVTDPQGADTVSGGDYQILDSDSGGELAAYTLTCNEGACIGSFRADMDSITCALEGSVTFRFVVEDEEGNLSAPVDYDF